MDKRVEKEIKSKTIEHNIYCDKCKKLIMSSVEYDDGYYETPPYLEKFNVEGYGWLKNDMDLCDECRGKMMTQIKLKLEELGYKITGR